MSTEQVTIDKSTAKKLYASSPAELQELFKSKFGNNFMEPEVTDRVVSFEDACKVLGLDATNFLPDFSGYPEKHRNAMIAHAKLVLIAEALNDGWQPNWNDGDEYKYYPWFEIDASEEKPSGFGFSYSDYGSWDTYSGVGSRLCYRTRELALYAGKQFQDLYKDYFLIG
jgi:hypothetical protein